MTSFATDIKPLFREVDIDHMSGFGVDLDKYEWMSQKANAESVRDFITGAKQPQMPPGGPFWDDEQVELLNKWIAEGCPP